MNSYLQQVITKTRERNPHEPEFLQAVEEVFSSVNVLISKHPEYEDQALLERLVEPERVVEFRVCWTDDANKVQVNRGYRVQFNSALGPYKGDFVFIPPLTCLS